MTQPTVTDEMVASLRDAARRRRAGRADGGDRVRQLHHPSERRARHRVGRIRRGVRPQAARAARRRTSGRDHVRGPVRRPPRPALHGRLRDARLGRRRRGRRAGDLAAVGRDRCGCARRGARPARVPGADGDPQGARPAARRTRGGARSTSASGCPSRCSPPRTWPTTSSSPRACRSRCSPCWRRSRPPSARCSCCARCSTRRTTRSPRRSASPRPPYARSGTGRGSTSPRADPRMEVSRAEQQEVVERFLAAVTQGDLQGLLDVLAPDVVLVADGGGVVQAVVNPVVGAKKVANLLRPFSRLAPERRDPADAAQRRARRPDRRHRRRLRHGDQLRGRGRAGSPASTPSATRPSSDGSTSRRRSAASAHDRAAG